MIIYEYYSLCNLLDLILYNQSIAQNMDKVKLKKLSDTSSNH